MVKEGQYFNVVTETKLQAERLAADWRRSGFKTKIVKIPKAQRELYTNCPRRARPRWKVIKV